MIFITVGSQLPFERLIQCVDEIASKYPQFDFIAQDFAGKYEPKNLRRVPFISPSEFNNYIDKADLIISHAGIGTLLNASELKKPLILYPRSGKLKETRDDHQIATCNMLITKMNLYVANNKTELENYISLFEKGKLQKLNAISDHASASLIESLKDFINKK